MRNESLNSLPKDNTLDLSELKAFADDKINVTQKLNFDLGRVKNIVEKGEIGLSPFPTMFLRPFLLRYMYMYALCARDDVDHKITRNRPYKNLSPRPGIESRTFCLPGSHLYHSLHIATLKLSSQYLEKSKNVLSGKE